MITHRMLDGDQAKSYDRVDQATTPRTFTPLLRHPAPIFNETVAFVKARSSVSRPNPDSRRFYRMNRHL